MVARERQTGVSIATGRHKGKGSNGLRRHQQLLGELNQVVRAVHAQLLDLALGLAHECLVLAAHNMRNGQALCVRVVGDGERERERESKYTDRRVSNRTSASHKV